MYITLLIWYTFRLYPLLYVHIDLCRPYSYLTISISSDSILHNLLRGDGEILPKALMANSVYLECATFQSYWSNLIKICVILILSLCVRLLLSICLETYADACIYIYIYIYIYIRACVQEWLWVFVEVWRRLCSYVYIHIYIYIYI